MKRISIAAAALVLLGGVGALLWPAYAKAKRSSDVWRGLQAAIKANQWEDVRGLLADTGVDLHEIRGDKIIYFGTHDYTEQVASQSIQFTETVLYYLTDPASKEKDKVVFGGGYAIIEDGRVTLIKYP